MAKSNFPGLASYEDKHPRVLAYTLELDAQGNEPDLRGVFRVWIDTADAVAKMKSATEKPGHWTGGPSWWSQFGSHTFLVPEGHQDWESGGAGKTPSFYLDYATRVVGANDKDQLYKYRVLATIQVDS